jgi:DNA-binding GntR family transcriptional regulator
MKTFAEAQKEIRSALEHKTVVRAITIPFSPLTKEEIEQIVADAEKEGYIAKWEDWLNHSNDFTNITFKRADCVRLTDEEIAMLRGHGESLIERALNEIEILRHDLQELKDVMQQCRDEDDDEDSELERPNG